MTLRLTLLLCLLSMLVSAALTRRYFPTVQTNNVTTQKEVVVNNIQTVVKTVKLPSGEVDITTTTEDHTQHVDTSTISAASPIKVKSLNVSALIANDFSRGILVPTYGISVSKEILGLITVGAFGLTNGAIGVSLGLNF